MFGKKVEYLHGDNGKIVGVNVGKMQFRIEQYNLMLNRSSFYVYDGMGNKVVNADSFNEIDWFINHNIR